MSVVLIAGLCFCWLLSRTDKCTTRVWLQKKKKNKMAAVKNAQREAFKMVAHKPFQDIKAPKLFLNAACDTVE